MAFTFFDHTGDIGVQVEAPSLDELFADAARALVYTLSEPRLLRPDIDRISITLGATELDLLLVDWLSELLFHFETAGFLPADSRVRVTRDGEAWRLDADLAGERAAAERLPVKVLVKAVTYHALEVGPAEGGGWRARLILDI